MRIRSVVALSIAAPMVLCMGCRQSTYSPVKPETPTRTDVVPNSQTPPPVDAQNAASPAQLAAVSGGDMATYKDDGTGVSFQYPNLWKPASQVSGTINPDLPSNFGAKHTVAFPTQRSDYAGTLLKTLQFTYAKRSASSDADCVAGLKDSMPEVKTSTATVNGVAFHQFSGSEGAACTDNTAQIDVAYRNGVCVAFERDFVTECSGADSSKKPLTAAQNTTLQQTLDGIFNSVRFSK